MKNGTYKITRSHRLDDLNDLVNQLVPRRHLEVMDVAVSSGTTTLEWIEALHKTGIDRDMTAGDSFMFGFIVPIGKNLHVLADKSGHPLQFEVFRETLPIPLPGNRALLKNLAPLLLCYGSLNTDHRQFISKSFYSKREWTDYPGLFTFNSRLLAYIGMSRYWPRLSIGSCTVFASRFTDQSCDSPLI